jgi:hypothetical protein
MPLDRFHTVSSDGVFNYANFRSTLPSSLESVGIGGIVNFAYFGEPASGSVAISQGESLAAGVGDTIGVKPSAYELEGLGLAVSYSAQVTTSIFSVDGSSSATLVVRSRMAVRRKPQVIVVEPDNTVSVYAPPFNPR